MISRRTFFGAIAYPAAAWSASCAATLAPDAHERIGELAHDEVAPHDVAANEDFWLHAQQAFAVDRSIVNLNNGGVCPSPAAVQAAQFRYLTHANTAPAYVMWRLQQQQKESVRAHLARSFGAGAEEIAITRNTSESLQICQQGLDLARGDEIVTTTQDYPRMITTWKQRERRDGVKLVQIEIPVPCADDGEIVRRFEAAITPRTRVVHMSHVVNLTGQILPVKPVVEMARARGIPVVVDGAHSFAHLDFRHADLDCDYFGTSLHKWLFAPIGTGMLYVRRDKIRALWPLMAANESQDDDVRKFEEIGTHPVGNFLAIADALTFHEGLGPARKLARLLYLRDRWAQRVAAVDRVRLHTDLAPGRSTGVANVEIDGLDAVKLADHLWTKHQIFVVAIQHAQFQGIRISPAVYTTVEEIDRFADALTVVAQRGI